MEDDLKKNTKWKMSPQKIQNGRRPQKIGKKWKTALKNNGKQPKKIKNYIKMKELNLL